MSDDEGFALCTSSHVRDTNGVSERLNRTLLERARSMLSQASLPQVFWAEVVNTTTYLLTLSPVSSIDFKTPYEMWYKRPANYSSLRVFGCEAFAHVPKEKKMKLDAKATRCVFLGYQKGVKG
ncbi:unnamed protein product [Calypogeia fissa]